MTDPASYGPDADGDSSPIRLVQTHISYVAVGERDVYKISKPVDMGFLDFSTFAKRRENARRQIELNRRLCPRLYEGVLAVVQRGGRLQWASEDAPDALEYAVKMRRLPAEGFLDRRLAEGSASAVDLDRVIEKLAAFYGQQQPNEAVSANGRVECVRAAVDATLTHAERGVDRPLQSGEQIGGAVSRRGAAGQDAVLDRAGLSALRRFCQGWYAGGADLFRRRIAEGRIVDGHGDLRPEHIHLSERGVCIYDCVEFNDKLRWIDVASDAAFLAMELDFAGRRDLSRHFVNRVAAAMSDDEMRKLVPFYECYRALVRAKVGLLSADESEIPRPQREESLRRAARYYQLALDYALAGRGPFILAVMGRIGSGKSTLAGQIAAATGWPVYSSDRIRKSLFNLPEQERSPVELRDRLYSVDASRRTYDRLFELALAKVSAGRSVILDATFARRDERSRQRELLRRLGVDCLFVELSVSDDEIRRRLEERDDAGAHASDARLEDFETLTARYQPANEIDPAHVLRLSHAAASPERPSDSDLLTVLNWLVARQLPA